MYSFNITILGEGHPLSPGWQGPGRYFNPPSPCGEGLQVRRPQVGDSAVSIHPPRVGRDTKAPVHLVAYQKFQSTLPVWGGTPPSFTRVSPPRFQSTLPVWGGTTARKSRRKTHKGFNPPSPCGEGRVRPGSLPRGPPVSIHPPRVGRDSVDTLLQVCQLEVSIHPPRVGRDLCQRQNLRFWPNGVSIHPPRVGRDNNRGALCPA